MKIQIDTEKEKVIRVSDIDTMIRTAYRNAALNHNYEVGMIYFIGMLSAITGKQYCNKCGQVSEKITCEKCESIFVAG